MYYQLGHIYRHMYIVCIPTHSAQVKPSHFIQVEGNLMINPEVVTVDQIADSVSTINLSFFSYTRNNQFQTSQKISLQTLLKEVRKTIQVCTLM